MSDDQILRTGVLFKKGSGVGPFGRKNWKPRYFVLTPARLKYFTFEDGELKGELDLSGCDEGVLEVMPADSMKTGSSASTIWRIAINAPERRLLVAAGTEMEMNDWVDKLVMAFRINSGQPPMQRASMPATSGAVVSGGAPTSNPSIRDFQNFAREQEEAAQQAELARQQRQREEEDEEEIAQAAALAGAEQLRLQEEQEKQRQKQLQVQQRQAMELQRAREAEEAARVQEEQLQEELRNQRLAEELAMQEQLKAQKGEDLLELQRRQKREEHARQRADRERAMREKEQQDLEFRMTAQMNSHFSVDDDSEDDSDHEPERSPMPPAGSSPVVATGPIGSGGLNDGDAARLSASAAPRSSLIGDVKREMMQKQQLEHQRRREAALKQEQQTRDAEWRQQQAALEQQRAAAEALGARESQREIEVVRRAPAKPKAPAGAAPMESFEF
ncbi:hypothetical protein BBJ28_00019038 [Nothophytophthora sp. Chile5]|nr:hypothetical protein BBJ28_00019038 [Nothophytophthora sp. Chile5]